MNVLLAAIARDETKYVGEWVTHHVGLGFDKVIIYDNESQTPLQCKEATVKYWPSTPDAAPQALAYNDCLNENGSHFDWVIFLDLDEFLNLKKHTSVKEFLADYANVDAICINWRMFGSSGRVNDEVQPVTERFVYASEKEFPPNAHVKTFFRPEAVSYANVHVPTLREGRLAVSVQGNRLKQELSSLNFDVDYSTAQINHYFTKSLREFSEKRKRGRADVADGAEGKHREEKEFEAYDRNEVRDDSILRGRGTRP